MSPSLQNKQITHTQTAKHIRKLLKTTKKKSQQAEEKIITLKGTIIRFLSDFSTETVIARKKKKKERNDIFKALKITANLEFYTQQKYFSKPKANQKHSDKKTETICHQLIHIKKLTDQSFRKKESDLKWKHRNAERNEDNRKGK